MFTKRQLLLFLGLTAVLIILAACGGSADVETVEVTRVVTETVTETVEVAGETETVTETVIEEVEEEAMDEADTVESDGAGDFSAIGSEDATGDVPPTPESGPKVEGTRTAADEVNSPSDEIAARAADDTTVTVSDEPAESLAILDENSQLTAGEVDDNLDFAAYQAYLNQYQGATIVPIPVQERYKISVTDSQNNPVSGADLQIRADNQIVAELRTHADGTAYFFPQVYGETAVSYTVHAIVNNQTVNFELTPDGERINWSIIHPAADQAVPNAQLDLLFLIDATGSMADEIQQLKDNIQFISAQIDDLPTAPDVRFGMVTYRDQGDSYLTQQTPFTNNVNAFATELAAVEAAGGGDYPEDLNSALSIAVSSMAWRQGNTVQLIFLVADAPPHLDYQQTHHYANSLQIANRLGIKIFPIASSGLDEQGEYIFRQLAQVTNGRFIFLTYGPEGSGTTGTETDLSVSNYSVSSLDQIVVNIVEKELNHLRK